MPANAIRDEDIESGEHEGLIQLVRDVKDHCEFYDMDPETAFSQVLEMINRDGGSVI